jgi:uncharacterized membrane protein YesL
MSSDDYAPLAGLAIAFLFVLAIGIGITCQHKQYVNHRFIYARTNEHVLVLSVIGHTMPQLMLVLRRDGTTMEVLTSDLKDLPEDSK